MICNISPDTLFESYLNKSVFKDNNIDSSCYITDHFSPESNRNSYTKYLSLNKDTKITLVHKPSGIIEFLVQGESIDQGNIPAYDYETIHYLNEDFAIQIIDSPFVPLDNKPEEYGEFRIYDLSIPGCEDSIDVSKKPAIIISSNAIGGFLSFASSEEAQIMVYASGLNKGDITDIKLYIDDSEEIFGSIHDNLQRTKSKYIELPAYALEPGVYNLKIKVMTKSKVYTYFKKIHVLEGKEFLAAKYSTFYKEYGVQREMKYLDYEDGVFKIEIFGSDDNLRRVSKNHSLKIDECVPVYSKGSNVDFDICFKGTYFEGNEDYFLFEASNYDEMNIANKELCESKQLVKGDQLKIFNRLHKVVGVYDFPKMIILSHTAISGIVDIIPICYDEPYFCSRYLSASDVSLTSGRFVLNYFETRCPEQTFVFE